MLDHPNNLLNKPSQTQHNNTTTHNTTTHNTTTHNTTTHNTIQHNTTQYNTIQHNTTQHKNIVSLTKWPHASMDELRRLNKKLRASATITEAVSLIERRVVQKIPLDSSVLHSNSYRCCSGITTTVQQQINQIALMEEVQVSQYI